LARSNFDPVPSDRRAGLERDEILMPELADELSPYQAAVSGFRDAVERPAAPLSQI
jgi:hypothetical protein